MKSINEPVLNYIPGSIERIKLEKEYDNLSSQKIEIPIIIDGKEIFTQDTGQCIQPHDHQKVLAVYHKAGDFEVSLAITRSLERWKSWSKTSIKERCNIFRNAASLLTPTSIPLLSK